MANFWYHSGAGNRLLNCLGHPLAAADRTTWALNLNLLAAAGIAGITNALFNNRTWDVTSFSHPFATANINNFGLCNRLADGVAHVFVAGFCFRLVSCAANLLVTRVVNGLANVVTNLLVAGVVNGLANGVAHVFVAGAVNRLTNLAGNFSEAGLVNGLAHIVCARSVVCFINRLANGVALVAIAGFVHVAGDTDRHCFRALIVNRLHAGVLLLFPDHFANSLVLRSTSTCIGKIA